MGRKKFIDKKTSVTYKLVCNEASREDDAAPKHVLVPISKGKQKIPCLFEPQPVPKKTERVFPSSGPRPDWDPDVVAGLDDDFDFDDEDNKLEDDFFAKANAPEKKKLVSSSKNIVFRDELCDEDDEDSDDFSSNFDEDEDSDDDFGKAHILKNYLNSKAKSTNYSMTSAVSTCTEEVKAFNERFEKIMEMYDDEQIGSLELEDIDGHLSPECERVQEIVEMAQAKEPTLSLGNYEDDVKRQILSFAENEKPEEFVVITTEKKAVEFDCQSILSTYSNIYNHPTLIKETPNAKSLRQRLTKANLKQLDKADSECGSRYTVATSFKRPKDETPEERKERKQAIKQTRRENRAIKKENKIAFKREKKLQDLEAINARRNVGVKIV